MELNRKRYNLPKLKTKKIPDKVNLSIEAAHAGIVNDNNFFYTPKSLVYGSKSLKKFYKPLQKAHYSSTLGYISDATYEKLAEYPSIDKSTTGEDLVNNVKNYLTSEEYKPDGLGILRSKALLFNKDKISKLYNQDDIGFVSIAGDTAAYCSICSKEAHLCDHIRGHKYNGEICFNIVDILEIDHISFESVPADTRTRTTVLDSKCNPNTVTIIEGQSMKLTIEEFKEYLKDLESVFSDLELSEFLTTYQKTTETAGTSDFLFPKESLGLLSTKLGLVVLTKALDKVEESEDLTILKNIVTKEYNKVIGEDVTIDEVVNSLVIVKDEVIDEPVEVVPEVVDTKTVDTETEVDLNTKVEDSFAAASFQNLTDMFTNMFTEYTEKLTTNLSEIVNQLVDIKTNKYYDDRVDSLEDKVKANKALSEQLTNEYKSSLLSQILMLKDLSEDSDYFLKLKERSVRELQLTLEDAKVDATKETKKQEVDVIVKPAVELETVSVTDVITNTPDNTDLDLNTKVEDADTIITDIISNLKDTKVLSTSRYKELYTNTLNDHGRIVAKKLYKTLKDQQMI